jgi:hypothetical protein
MINVMIDRQLLRILNTLIVVNDSYEIGLDLGGLYENRG